MLGECVERGNQDLDVKREAATGSPRKARVSMRGTGAEQTVVVLKVL